MENKQFYIVNAYTASNIWSGENTKYPLWVAEYGAERPSNSGTWKELGRVAIC